MRHEAVPGLGAQRLDRVAGAVRELDLDERLLDAASSANCSIRRWMRSTRSSSGPANPGTHKFGIAQNRLSARAAWPAATWARPSSVTIRPRGVRWMNPSWSRYGS